MTIIEALTIFDLADDTPAELKRAYRSLCKIYHPDVQGNEEMMKLVNGAYDLLVKAPYTIDMIDKAKGNIPLTEVLSKAYNSIKYLFDIDIELAGSWLWVTGETRKHKDYLKGQGFKFSRKKLAWYYHAGSYRKLTRRRWDMTEIRTRFDAMKLQSEEQQHLT